jgi:hypothetical protein
MPLSAKFSHRYCSFVGVERPYPLFSITKEQAIPKPKQYSRLHENPLMVAPPVKTAVTLPFFLSLANAIPSASAT